MWWSKEFGYSQLRNGQWVLVTKSLEHQTCNELHYYEPESSLPPSGAFKGWWDLYRGHYPFP